jgi:hypothetical protein
LAVPAENLYDRENQMTSASQPSVKRPSSEKRSGSDRRKSRFPQLKYVLFSGRRERQRRASDKQQFALYDRYSPRIFAAIIAILFLSVMDALLTLFLIEQGSRELNPIMALSLKGGPFTFFAVKYSLTSMAVVIFLIFKNTYVRRLRLYTSSIFSWVIALFGAVVTWELFLIALCFH